MIQIFHDATFTNSKIQINDSCHRYITMDMVEKNADISFFFFLSMFIILNSNNDIINMVQLFSIELVDAFV